MALGEHRGAWPDVTHMLFIKISTGIGTGLIMDGALQRGAQGAAGDLGHLFVGNIEPEHTETAAAAIPEMTWGLRLGLGDLPRSHAHAVYKADNVRDIAALAQQRRARRGRVAADLRPPDRQIGRRRREPAQPSLVVLGGELALPGYVLAAVRKTVYRRSLPLATRNLQIATSTVGHDAAGLMGAAQLVKATRCSRRRSSMLFWSQARQD